MAKLTMKLERVCGRPEAPIGFTFAMASVSAGGHGLFLFVENEGVSDIHATESLGIGIFPKPRMQEAKEFKLGVVSTGTLRWVDIPPIDIAFPHVELFPDGRI